MKDDDEKAAEILKKRRLAAKGLAERKDGKPIDPLEDVGELDPDNDIDAPLTPEEKQKRLAASSAVIGLGLKR